MPAPTALMVPRLNPCAGQDVPCLLSAQAERRPDSVFLVFAPFDAPAERWTYRDFHAAVGQVARALADVHGVRTGSVVLLHMDNCSEFLLAWHAVVRLGALVVTTNTRSAGEELAYLARHCGATMVVTQPAHEAALRDAAPQIRTFVVTRNDGGAQPAIPRSPQAVPFETLLDPAHAPWPERPADPALPMSVQYTSGTTARPKGVVWTHANGVWGARTNAVACGVRPDDIGHTFLPLFHTNALCYSHLATLWAGATLVLQPRFSASRYWPCVVDHRCTWGVQIPFSLKALLGLPVPQDHALTRWGLGAIDPALVKQVFGLPCIGWFGMTETVGLPIVSCPGLPGREMAMGLAAPGYEVAVRRDDGSDAPFGESGQLWIRGIPGLSMFLEYLGDPGATARSFDAEGWFETGDLVTAFEDGHIRFDGREKDMLRIGAENVGAAEIERAVMSAGGLVEVAVVGKPDPMLDEVPVVYVIAMGDTTGLQDRIHAACERLLADFKRPREIHVVTELPRVTLGKVDKKLLRARLAESAQEAERDG
jgi:carnitine-CoA ligase